MKSFLKKSSIRRRFNILLVSITLALISIIVFFVITFKGMQDYRNYNQNIDKLTIHYLNIRRFEQHFLLRYREDAGFFTTGKNKYLKKHENSIEKFAETLEILKKDPISRQLNLEENLNKVESYKKQYNEIFKEIAKKTYERGSQNNGIIGEMKIAARISYDLAPSLKIKKQIFYLMQLTDSYPYNKDPKYYKKFMKDYDVLFKLVSSSGKKYFATNDTLSLFIDSTIVATKSNRKEFVRNLNDFKFNFSSLIKIDQQIGTTYKDGLEGSLRSEIHKIDPEIAKVTEKVGIEQLNATSGTLKSIYLFFAIIIAIIILILWQFSKSITVPLNYLKTYISPLSRGKLPEKITKVKGNDEIAEMTESINELVTGLKKTTDFASSIGKGVFDTDYTPLSNEDELGNSLIEMRLNLNQAKIGEEKRKLEDDMRKWANEGLAKFNDILRDNTGDIDLLSNTVIKELVYFLKANQAGLFIYNNDENDKFFELIASYAFDQEKKKHKKIYPGEGLVGTVAVEKETIYMTDIPNSYITITSGLGGANPRSLLIVPMKVEDEVFGIIEIASFHKFQSHEIEFVEKISENIASSLSITRINSRTAELLEQSQLQAEQMAAQEEEMRQNFEELQQAQEASALREAEMASILAAINDSSLVIELNTKGYITTVNKGITDLLGVKKDRLLGMHHHDFIISENELEYNEFWRKLRHGEYISKTERLVSDKKEFWFSVIYAPIKDDNGHVLKILSLATDLTESKRLEIEMLEQAEAMFAQEEEMRQNLEELHSTQEEMAKKQTMLEEANLKSKINEKELLKVLEKTKQQENELQKKVRELNDIQNDLEDQHTRIISINEELADTEIEMRDRFNAVDKNNLVAEYNLNGTLINANNTFLKTFKYNMKDVISRHHRMFLHDSDKKTTAYKKFWDEIRKGKTFDSEYRRVDKDGKMLFFRGIYVPIKDTEDKTYKILEILTDISKLKYAEARFTSQMESIQQTNAIVEFDTLGKITLANTQFCIAVEYKKEDVIGKLHKELIEESYAETEDYHHFWRTLARGGRQGGLFTFISKFGDKKYLQGTYTAIKDPQGKVEKIMFLAYDITKLINDK